MAIRERKSGATEHHRRRAAAPVAREEREVVGVEVAAMVMPSLRQHRRYPQPREGMPVAHAEVQEAPARLAVAVEREAEHPRHAVSPIGPVMLRIRREFSPWLDNVCLRLMRTPGNRK